MLDFKTHKMVLLGDGGVGKTALTLQLCSAHFVENYNPTIENVYRKQVVIDDKACILEVLDTAGQQEYSTLREQWIREGEAFLLVYCITERSSFERLEDIRQHITSTVGSKTTPMILIGNKCDKTSERQVTQQEGLAMARRFGCQFIESSAKTAVNVEKAFFALVRSLRQVYGDYYSKKRPSIRKKFKKLKCTVM
ncbi:RAS2 protein [Basidiobolus ranarum]|uniref:RAS2 protein n=1 Tax=Basidiobolus ranarum TaxID=34480 RepID=A0ABR2W0L5_9FUNG